MFSFLPLSVKLYLGGLVFVLGAVLGSAFNCLAFRLAREQKWSGGRSVCPACGHTLAPLDLIPLLSYALLRGKCRYCGTKVSPRYPASEAFLGVVLLSVLLRFGFSMDALVWAVFCCCLFTLSLVDLEIQIIPDRFLLIPAIFRLIQLFIEGNLLSGILPGLAIGGGVLVLSLIMDKILQKDTMGGGDIKLLAVLGLYFSFAECLLMLILACVIGIVIASVLMKVESDAAFPFGPALSLAAWITMLIGQPLVSWYLGLF